MLSPEQKQQLLLLYGSVPVQALAYGTAKDYCDSADHLPFLSHLHRDLKDLQRPAALKAILGLVAPGGRLIEIGAGEPIVANLLSEFGYDVTVVDPYDGSGNGPTEYALYVSRYPHLRIIQEYFTDQMLDLLPGAYDAVYSISVLEHVPPAALAQLFTGVRRCLKPSGISLHLVDYILQGLGEEWNFQQLIDILALQAHLSGEPEGDLQAKLSSLLAAARTDVETYCLSVEGHNFWRGTVPYDSFPYRKVISIQTYSQRT